MPLQISVRDMLLGVLIVGVGFAGLLSGGWVGSLAMLAGMLLFTALTIVAFVGHGPWRSFGTGYAIVFCIYLLPHLYFGRMGINTSWEPPTVGLWGSVYENIVKLEYFDAVTGRPLPSYTPPQAENIGGSMLSVPVGNVMTMPTPDRETFMLTAHLLAATLLACVGGKFAVAVSRGVSKRNGPNGSEENHEAD